MRNRILIAVTAALMMVVTAACGGGGDPTRSEGSQAPSDTVVVGSANFPESELLAEMYAAALEAKGVKVDKKLNIGARELYLKALEDGSIDLLPEYNGALLAALAEDGVPEGVTSPEQVNAELQQVLPEGTVTLAQSAAEDKDVLTVTAVTAEQFSLQRVSDLQGKAEQMTLAGGPEFAERHQGVKGLEEVYGLKFKEFKPLDSGGPLTLGALLQGDVQVANLFSTDPAVVENQLVALEDDKQLFTSQNVLPLVREAKADERVRQALDAVSAELTTEDLLRLNEQVQVEKRPAAQVAKDYLTEKGLV